MKTWEGIVSVLSIALLAITTTTFLGTLNVLIQFQVELSEAGYTRGVRPVREVACVVAFSFLAFILLLPIQAASARLERNRILPRFLVVLHLAFFLSILTVVIGFPGLLLLMYLSGAYLSTS